MKLGKIMIFVSDLGRAKVFYRDVLGFPLSRETENRLDFEHDGCDFVAFKCEKNTRIEDYSNEARSVFVFEVESVVDTMDELLGCIDGAAGPLHDNFQAAPEAAYEIEKLLAEGREPEGP